MRGWTGHRDVRVTGRGERGHTENPNWVPNDKGKPCKGDEEGWGAGAQEGSTRDPSGQNPGCGCCSKSSKKLLESLETGREVCQYVSESSLWRTAWGRPEEPQGGWKGCYKVVQTGLEPSERRGRLAGGVGPVCGSPQGLLVDCMWGSRGQPLRRSPGSSV